MSAPYALHAGPMYVLRAECRSVLAPVDLNL
jgi:hypothetical protein